MIRADRLVAETHVGARAEKQRAVVAHVVKEIIRIPRHDLDVFGGYVIGDAHHFLFALGDDDLAIGFPRFARVFRGRQDGEQAIDLGHGCKRERL